MKLLQIPPDMTDQVWASIEPMLAPSIEYSCGTQTIETVRERLKTGHAQLWLVVEDEYPHKIMASIVTSLMDYPSGKRAVVIEFMGGSEMKQWAELRSEIEDWGAKNGCSFSVCWIRKGLVKHLPDYKLSHYFMMKELVA